MKKISVLFVLGFLFLSTTAFALVDIGSGYSCDGSDIKKGSKTVTYSKAKSNLATTIQKLQQQVSNASGKKKKALQDKIKNAKQIKIQITSCHNGTLLPTEVDPIFTTLAANGGAYSGNYSGVVTSPLGNTSLSGTITMQFTLIGTVFKAILTLGGNLGNALDAEPLTFENDMGGVGFPAQIVLQNTFLGTVTLSIGQNGELGITSSGSSKGSATLQAQFANSNISGSLNGTYSIASFQGSFSLTR